MINLIQPQTPHPNTPDPMTDFQDYMLAKNLAAATRKKNKERVVLFLKWLETDPIGCTKKDILGYLAFLKEERQLQNVTLKNTLIALRHYFAFLQSQSLIATNPTAFIKIRGANRKHLYHIYTHQELTQLCDDYEQLWVKGWEHHPHNQYRTKDGLLAKQRNQVIVQLLAFQGIGSREVHALQVEDIDLVNATIYLKASKTTNERTVPLHASQMGHMMQYLHHIRPAILTYHQQRDTEQLFMAAPKNKSRGLFQKPHTRDILTFLSRQLKETNPHFVNVYQLRASVITYWIQTQGLRQPNTWQGTATSPVRRPIYPTIWKASPRK